MPSEQKQVSLSKWKRAGFVATIAIVLAFPLYLTRVAVERRQPPVQSGPYFVGRAACVECHKREDDLWLGSHHDMAMDSATVKTVLADFNDFEFTNRGITHRMFMKEGRFFVNTPGPGGEFADFEVTYTFGYTPLQQYLVPMEGGRLQCLPLAWDSEKNLWFHLGDTVYGEEEIEPDNWLYWTNQAQNWNGMCADCHTTNLKKNYDPESGTYNTTWSEIDVSCEACHGPSSGHIEWANLPEGSRPADVNTGLIVRTSDLDNRELLNLCARCHSRRTIMGDYDNDNGDLLNYMVPQLITQPIYHADGQILEEDYVYGSFTQSRMFEKLVKCSDCHDSHSVKTLWDDNELCLQCHRPDIYDSPSHHFHKMPPAGGTRLVNIGKPLYVTGTGSQCVNCHMVGQYYMGNDYRRDHSFRIPRPDLTLSIGTPNACNDCHTDKSVKWSQDYIEEWYGSRKRKHYGEVFAAAADLDTGAVRDLVLYAGNELYPLMIRATAISLLSGFDDSLSRSTIATALSDPESLVRRTAIGGYRSDNAQGYLESLSPLLNDPIKSVRVEAAINLSQFPSELMGERQKQALDAALREYEEVNLYVADFPGGRYNLGIMYGNMGNIEKAAGAYREAIRIDNLFYMAKVNLATIYARQGNLAETERLLREVLVEQPALLEVNYSMALLLAEKGDIEGSRAFFLRSLELMPDRPRIIYNLALLENSQGNITKAENYFLKALAAEPSNFDFLYATSTFYFEHGEKLNALEYAEKLARLYPGNQMATQLLQTISR